MRKILIILIIVLILLIAALLFRIIRNRQTSKNCPKIKGGFDYFAEVLGIGQPCKNAIEGDYYFKPLQILKRFSAGSSLWFVLVCGLIIDEAYPINLTPLRCVFVVKYSGEIKPTLQNHDGNAPEINPILRDITNMNTPKIGDNLELLTRLAEIIKNNTPADVLSYIFNFVPEQYQNADLCVYLTEITKIILNINFYNSDFFQLLGEIIQILSQIFGDIFENIEDFNRYKRTILNTIARELPQENTQILQRLQCFAKIAIIILKPLAVNIHEKRKAKSPAYKNTLKTVLDEMLFYKSPFLYILSIIDIKKNLTESTAKKIIKTYNYMISNEFAAVVFDLVQNNKISPANELNKNEISVINSFRPLNYLTLLNNNSYKEIFNKLPEKERYFYDFNYYTNQGQAELFEDYRRTNTAFAIMEKSGDNRSVLNSYAYIYNFPENIAILNAIFYFNRTNSEKDFIKIHIVESDEIEGAKNVENVPGLYKLTQNYRNEWEKYIKREKRNGEPFSVYLHDKATGLTNFAGLYQYGAIFTNTDMADIIPNSLIDRELYMWFHLNK